MRPEKEGYYWYRECTEINGRKQAVGFEGWDIVKVQHYSSGHYKNNPCRMKKPILMYCVFSCWIKGLIEVKKSIGIWGNKVANLKDDIGLDRLSL